jgi:hypothetical protein
MRQFPHDRDSHIRKFTHHPHERIRRCVDTRRPFARIVAVRGTSHRIAISPTISFAPSVATVIGPRGLDQDLGLTGDDQIGSICLITLVKQHLAVIEADARS